MKVTLRIRKAGSSLFESVYEINDAESFGKACTDAWIQIRDRQLGGATSIGDFMDRMDQNVLDQLHDAEIVLAKP
jgi:hypothetical protein